MTRRPLLRASDSDRDQVAERLRQATAEGRLLAEELEERLGIAFSARTYGELDAVVADLPGNRAPRTGPPLWMKAGFAVAAVMAVLAVLALVALVVAGLAGAWLAWMIFAWVFFGRGRGCSRGQSRHRARAVRGTVPRVRAPGSGPAPLL